MDWDLVKMNKVPSEEQFPEELLAKGDLHWKFVSVYIHRTGHHAVAFASGDQYYGAKAIINVWAPRVIDQYEFCLSQVWVISASFGNDLNTIEAGWQVSPELYGDNYPRFFTYWITDAYQTTGCYNLLCLGFVQIHVCNFYIHPYVVCSSTGGSAFANLDPFYFKVKLRDLVSVVCSLSLWLISLKSSSMNIYSLLFCL